MIILIPKIHGDLNQISGIKPLRKEMNAVKVAFELCGDKRAIDSTDFFDLEKDYYYEYICTYV